MIAIGEVDAMPTDPSEDRAYRLVVLELDDIKPRIRADRPNLYVGMTLHGADELAAGLNQGRYKPSWARHHVVRVREDLCPEIITDRVEARAEMKKLESKLRSKGYTVNRITQAYRTYVIDLHDPDLGDPGKGYVYVGQTSKSVEDRLQEHLTGARSKKGHKLASAVVKRFGQSLNHDLMTEKVYPTKRAALKAERRLADRLRKAGYVVEGGH